MTKHKHRLFCRGVLWCRGSGEEKNSGGFKYADAFSDPMFMYMMCQISSNKSWPQNKIFFSVVYINCSNPLIM